MQADSILGPRERNMASKLSEVVMLLYLMLVKHIWNIVSGFEGVQKKKFQERFQ